MRLQGMPVKYLGSSCQYEVCEYGCAGQHQFYRARVLPPRALPEPDSSYDADLATSLAQAHAAASGRPVLLILDLHPRLMCPTLEALLHITTPEQLQASGVVGRMGLSNAEQLWLHLNLCRDRFRLLQFVAPRHMGSCG